MNPDESNDPYLELKIEALDMCFKWEVTSYGPERGEGRTKKTKATGYDESLKLARKNAESFMRNYQNE